MIRARGIVNRLEIDGVGLVAGPRLSDQLAGQPRTKLVPKRPALFGTEKSESTIEFVEKDGRVTSVLAAGVAFKPKSPEPNRVVTRIWSSVVHMQAGNWLVSNCKCFSRPRTSSIN